MRFVIYCLVICVYMQNVSTTVYWPFAANIQGQRPPLYVKSVLQPPSNPISSPITPSPRNKLSAVKLNAETNKLINKTKKDWDLATKFDFDYETYYNSLKNVEINKNNNNNSKNRTEIKVKFPSSSKVSMSKVTPFKKSQEHVSNSSAAEDAYFDLVLNTLRKILHEIKMLIDKTLEMKQRDRISSRMSAETVRQNQELEKSKNIVKIQEYCQNLALSQESGLFRLLRNGKNRPPVWLNSMMAERLEQNRKMCENNYKKENANAEQSPDSQTIRKETKDAAEDFETDLVDAVNKWIWDSYKTDPKMETETVQYFKVINVKDDDNKANSLKKEHGNKNTEIKLNNLENKTKTKNVESKENLDLIEFLGRLIDSI